MLIYRIDYETFAAIDRVHPKRTTRRLLTFRATKPEVDQFKKECEIDHLNFRAVKIDVPTGRYELVDWLNKTFGSNQ